jgi:hypothetical protein
MAMRIGIVADIHDAVRPLTKALSILRGRGAEQIVSLGDAFDSFRPGEPAVEVARLLQEAGAVGVWGNHDAGLSLEVMEQMREAADPALLAFSARLQPQLVLEGCRFSHVEPWKNPCRLEDLWWFEGLPDTGERARRSFDAVRERLLFVGHFHASLVMRAEGQVEWNGVLPVKLSGLDRYLILVPAVVDGWCEILETEQCLLTPIRCSV